MRQILSLLIAVVLAVVLSVGCSYVLLRSGGQGGHQETAYDRVIRTGTLRCGYVLFQPAVYVDPHTGKKIGFMVDLVEELGKRLGVKVVWAEEATFGNMFEGLKAGRYDAVCSATWISAGRSRVAEFTTPFLFSYIVPIVRADDKRFDESLRSVNAPSTTLAVIDGDITAEIAENDFPKAKTVSTPQMADAQQALIDVISKKADMTFEEWTKVQLFSQKNPGKLKVVHPEKPLRVFPWAIAVGKGEHSLESLLSGGLTELLYSGSVEQIVKKNQPIPHSYYFFKPPIAGE